MAAYQRKTWTEKLEGVQEPVVKKLEKDFAGMKAGERMLIATPGIVDAYIRQIPKGQTATLTQMRNDLAAAYGADVTCPVTAGIFLRIAAEAAHEAYEKGTPLRKITPFWRMMDATSATARKLSFGTDLLLQQRKKEGITERLQTKSKAASRKKQVPE